MSTGVRRLHGDGSRQEPVKEFIFEVGRQGQERQGRARRDARRRRGHGQRQLRRQGILVTKVKKRRMGGGGKSSAEGHRLFTRQLATMMKAGVPLLQAFDIVGGASPTRAVTKLLNDIRTDVETGTSLSQAFRKHPMHFDALFCNLVEAPASRRHPGQPARPPGDLQGKDLAIKQQDQVGAVLPDRGAGRGLRRGGGHHDLRDPGVQGGVHQLRRRPAGADADGDGHVGLLRRLLVPSSALIGGGIYFFFRPGSASEGCRSHGPPAAAHAVFGDLIRKATIARWTRTLSTMFAAGVPLVEALDSVGGASGNYVYAEATEQIQRTSPPAPASPVAMQNTNVFPNMVLQMASIGEESGSLDRCWARRPTFYEREVDEMVKACPA
jgi:type IV pilus assembly protein PilC